MSLQFVIGNSGSGKSDYLYQHILEEAGRHPELDYLLIVPEQFTMQTQKELVTRQKSHAIMNIDVLSFQRMAFRVFEELGRSDLFILEETGKNLMLRKIAQEKAPKLKVLQGNVRKLGYINEIKSLISELTQYNVQPQDMDQILANQSESELFQMKLKDVQLIYQTFLEKREGKYITAEEILEVLADIAQESQILKNSVLILDGFTGFTPLQNRLLRKLFPILKKIYVSVCMDTREDYGKQPKIQNLFYMSQKMIQQLTKIAQETKVAIEDPILTTDGDKKRFCNSKELFYLEQNLFRRSSLPYAEEPKDVQIYSLRNPREELLFCARTISAYVRTQKYRYRDFAIVTGNMEEYGNYAQEVFDAYKVPIFLDEKRTILYHPFVEAIRAILEVAEHDFSYESIFRFLKGGFSMVTMEEADAMENYCLALGIRGKKAWREPWIKIPYSWKEEQIEGLEALRQRVMGILDPFIECILDRKKNVRQMSEALYQLFLRMKVSEQLKRYQQLFEDKKELAKAKEYEQIYQIVLDLLDKIVELLGEESLSIREYKEILESGFEAAKVGVIPPGHDRVVIGDIERTRLDHIRILFFVGVNDGNIPKTDQGGGLISQMERERLAQYQIELAPSGRERVFIQKFYLYLNLTKPQEKLYLTYAQLDTSGQSIRKSYLISTMEKLFPKIKVREVGEEEKDILTPRSSLAYYIYGLQNIEKAKTDPFFHALHQWYMQQEAWREKIEDLVDATFYHHEEKALSDATARALYGAVLVNSVSRLERFATCAYAHFLQYGLHLKERQLCEWQGMDMGNIFHATLERFANEVEKEGKNWADLTREEQEEILDAVFEQSVNEFHGEALNANARNRHMKQRMRRIMDRTIWAITQQLQSGSFKPEGYEVSFQFAENLESVNFALSETEQMSLRGKIDRVDTYETKDKLYVKIIDYKTGTKEFQLISLYHGVNLQLVLYMNAAKEILHKKYKDKEIEPAGIFYYVMDDPIIDAKKPMRDEEIWKEIYKKLKLQGVVSSEEEAYRAMDRDFTKSSDIIPIQLDKDGVLKKTSKVASKEEFAIMSRYVRKKIEDLGRQMLKGEIAVSPYSLEDTDGCQYCMYKGICGFDERLSGFERRKLETFAENDAIFEAMKKACEEKKEEGEDKTWESTGAKNKDK